MRKIPIARKWDIVEKIDMSEVCGVVRKVYADGTCDVEWGYNEETTEKINDLALVERR